MICNDGFPLSFWSLFNVTAYLEEWELYNYKLDHPCA